MGVGLVSRYRYSKDSELTTLANDIEDQIATYLPQFTSVSVELTLTTTKDLFIQIIIDGVAYELIYKTEYETLEAVKE
jgi:predicted component of type VI protein secretion system